VARRTGTKSREHRKPKLRRPDAPLGWCRLCGKKIVVDDEFIEYQLKDTTSYWYEDKKAALERRRGTHAIRANWHPRCGWEYRNGWGTELRRRVYARDKGRCAVCHLVTDTWEADHIVPLIRGKRALAVFALDNVQTLCQQHHKEKTIRENKARNLRLAG
jgi:hypothetical protein